MDANNDGVVDTRGTLPRYELRLTHSRNSGLIWLSHLVLPTRYINSDLRTLARLYVESVAGAGIVVTDVGDIHETRFATRVVREEPGVVDGFEALYVAFEVANVDQLALSPDSRWRRVEITLIRSGHLWSAPRSTQGVLGTILVAGHQNDPEVFAETSADFHRFVESIDFRHAEFAAANAVVGRCTTRSSARVHYVLGGLRFVSPDLTAEEMACVRRNLPDGETGFAFQRNPAVAPAPTAPAPAPAPPAPAPAAPAPAPEPTTPANVNAEATSPVAP